MWYVPTYIIHITSYVLRSYVNYIIFGTKLTEANAWQLISDLTTRISDFNYAITMISDKRNLVLISIKYGWVSLDGWNPG